MKEKQKLEPGLDPYCGRSRKREARSLLWTLSWSQDTAVTLWILTSLEM